MNTVAIDAYRECCERRGVRPNVQIMAQLKSPATAVELPALDASSTFLGSLGVHALLDFAHLHQGVKHLCLKNNGVDASNIQHLYSLMEVHQSLGSCDLSENSLSTPSVRLLWELARHVNTVQRIGTEGTGIADEWKQRLQRALQSNEEFQVLGFHSYGVDRPLTQWGAAYICVVGPMDRVAHVTDSVLPALNSFVAGMRLRVSPIVITPLDTLEVMTEKLSLCADPANNGRVWCVAFLSSKDPLLPVAQAALDFVAQTSMPPDVPPLHNKLGEIREPMYRYAKNIFIICEPLQDMTKVGRGDDDEQAAAAAFASVARPLLEHRCAYSLESRERSSIDLRLLSSLYASLKIVYSQDPTVTRAVSAYDWELADRLSPVGQFYPKELTEVLRYCEPTSTSCAFPLVLYGSGSGGKDEILAAAACTLRDSSSALQRKVVPYFVEGASSRSIVVLLYFLLDVFCPQAVSEVFPTLRDLMVRTRKCIEAYEGECDVAVFLSGIEFLSYCDVFNTATSLEWLPATFPASVRLILSLRTESPLLLSLRSRSPLPFELLVNGLPMSKRLGHLRSLLSQRGISFAELTDEVITSTNDAAVGVNLSGNTIVDSLAAKEDSDLYLYITALAAYLSTCGEGSDLASCMRAAPETTEGVVRSLLGSFEQRLGHKLVMSVVLALASSSLPATELVLVCETIIGCERYTTVPAIAALTRDGLITCNGANVLRLANSVVATAVKEQYSGFQQEADEIASAVASHMHRLVTTRSPELLFAFRRVFSLLIQSWQDSVAEALLFDASLVDLVLREDVLSRRYMVDAVFSLTTYRERLAELYEGKYGVAHFAHDPSRLILRNLLRDVQQLPRAAFQGALLLSRDSPLRQSASRQSPPYVCLFPFNEENEELLSLYSVAAQAHLSHCHRFDDVVCATSADQVVVCNAGTGAVIAKSVARPLGLDHTLVGSLVISATEIAVVCREQVALWNLEYDSWSSVLDVTCSLSGHSFDSLRQHILVVHLSTRHVSLLDIHRKKVTSTFGEVFSTGSVREARFLGPNVAVVSIYDMVLIAPTGERHILSHPTMINCVASSVDGKIVAVGVDKDVWLWTHLGQHLHICSGHSQRVLDVAFHASGSTVISTSADQSLRVWNSISGQEKAVLHTDLRDPADYVSFTPDGCKILARCGDFLRQWDSVTYQSAGAVNACAGFISFFSLTNAMVIAATDGGFLKAWSLTQSFATVTQAVELNPSSNISRNSKVAPGHAAVVSASTCSSTMLLTLTEDGCLKLWSVGRTGPPMILQTDSRCFVARPTGPNVARVVSFSSKLTVLEIRHSDDVDSGSVAVSEVGIFPIMRDAEPSANFALTAFSDFSQIVLTMNLGPQTRLCLFETQQFSITNQLSGHFDAVVMTEPVQQFLVTASRDCTVRLWNLAAHAERCAYQHSRQLTSAVASLSTADPASVDVVVFDAEGCMTIVRVALAGQIHVLATRQVGLTAPALAYRLSAATLLVVCEGGVAVVDQPSMSLKNQLTNLDVSVADVGNLLVEGDLFGCAMLGTRSGQLLLCKILSPA